MKIEEILQIVDSVSKSALAEFKYEEGGVKLSLKKAAAVHAAPGNVAITALTNPSAASGGETADSSHGFAGGSAILSSVTEEATKEKKESGTGINGKIIKSPLVGTFYSAPSEDAEPFVRVGDSVKEGQVLAIVEAMKLMNDIESDYTGVITEILVKNGDTVEYGQPLFAIS